MFARLKRFLPPLLLTLAAVLAIALCASAQSDAAARSRELSHVVRPGETLQTISKHYFGTTRNWQQIYKLNRSLLSSPEQVEPGMRLRIVAGNAPAARLVSSSRAPASDSRPTHVVSPAAAARAAVQQAAREPAQKSSPYEGPGALVEILVQPGDTLESLAERHMGSKKFWRRIVELNPLKLKDPEDLQPGMTIQVQDFDSNPQSKPRNEKYAAVDMSNTTETLEIPAAATTQPPVPVAAATLVAAPAPPTLPHYEEFVAP